MSELLDFMVPAGIALIMFGIGINIKASNFTRVFRHPKAIITGLSLQMVLLPIMAFAIVWFWPMEPIYKAGFILIAACPGGTASNLLTFLLRGRIALSVSLTAFNSFLILFTIPFIVSIATDIFLGSHQGISLSFWEIFSNMLITVIAPVLLGVLVNEKGPEKWVEPVKGPLRYILLGIMLAIFILVSLSEEGGRDFNLSTDYILVFPGLLLNISTMITGYLISRRAGITHRGSYTIAIEMGLQNVALAIFIATSILEQPKMALVGVLYSATSFITSYLVGFLLRKRGEYLQED
ncbi:MAG TPA: hypothetical protein DCG19_03155 [Cryomorphaceae bacterium]|nr:hypothetical protein [Owenweeksia sp.]MBG00454.1 hypothetical protein [Owenweeksia sp.]HAD96375.1 hypothetical protein [Cryomorphaceae bacterium]HBF19161.1 hypothetical protein [Cryomorphaceae bacterium]HCQ17284.1 hypothetical protein [Cryomorphaceae bacterium]|tara:strand:+ start:660 stop:1541 length:882 start_codon:yes stop_codon:yes gene_type:complete